MLGRSIADPIGMEGPKGTVRGLGLLDIDTVFGSEKRLGRVTGVEIASGAPVAGYEIHLAKTTGKGLERPMLRLEGRSEGAVSPDGLVAGCYLHGLFSSDRFRRAFLDSLGVVAGEVAYEHRVEAALNALADHLERHLDLSALLAAARPPRFK